MENTLEDIYRIFNNFLTHDKNGNKGKVHSMSVFLVMMQALGLDPEFIYEELLVRAKNSQYVRSCSHIQSFARKDVPTNICSWNKWISAIDDKIVLSKKGYICYGKICGIPEKVCVWEYDARHDNDGIINLHDSTLGKLKINIEITKKVSNYFNMENINLHNIYKKFKEYDIKLLEFDKQKHDVLILNVF